MSKRPKNHDPEFIDDDDDDWEAKRIGTDLRYARRASKKIEKQIDDTLGLQAISIRLQKELVEQIKELANRDGIGYQPYIRQVLTRHVRETAKKAGKRG